jgi:hypothetical protein
LIGPDTEPVPRYAVGAGSRIPSHVCEETVDATRAVLRAKKNSVLEDVLFELQSPNVASKRFDLLL